jgi:hypothetical protein
MLDPRASAIEYASQIELIKRGNDLITDNRLGRHSNKRWQQLIDVARMLDSLSVKIFLSASQQSKLTYIYDCLVNTLRLNRYPAPPSSLPIIITDDMAIGIPGPQGPAGVSSYLYFAWADSTLGAGFTTTYSVTKPYMAFIQSTSPILSLTASLFSGKWFKVLGTDGTNGTDGVDGTNGTDGTDGNTVLYGTVNPGAGIGVDGNFYINTSTWTIFGPKTGGSWPAGTSIIGPQGDPGNDGTNGNSFLSGSGVPSNGLGNDGDFYIDLSAVSLYGPKQSGLWPTGIPLVGPTGPIGLTGATGATGANGSSAFLYVAWADDNSGSGFTTTFDPAKDYIAFLSTTTEIPTPTASDFSGLWAKYRGAGDRWTTTSLTSTTIGAGTQTIVVETGLAYSTGQRTVISVPGDPNFRMEGIVVSYDSVTGQLTVLVDTIYGAGTFSSWDVSIQAGGGGSDFITFTNSDVDTGTETLDTVLATTASTIVWTYEITKGLAQRSGVVLATVNSGTTVSFYDNSTDDLGTVDVELSVTVSGTDILLRATATSDNWFISGKRQIIV